MLKVKNYFILMNSSKKSDRLQCFKREIRGLYALYPLGLRTLGGGRLFLRHRLPGEQGKTEPYIQREVPGQLHRHDRRGKGRAMALSGRRRKRQRGEIRRDGRPELQAAGQIRGDGWRKRKFFRLLFRQLFRRPLQGL